jgi:DNA polymerase-4
MQKIIHVDMDCYFAAVEMRDNPRLKDIPIAIGGAANRRGVIATCNYPARHYGVGSAMPTSHALKLCPSLALLPGRMQLYQTISKQLRGIFARYTHKIEPLSIDEAYLDVSDSSLFNGSATLIAEDIRQSILSETGLTASAGVAPCKFVAKVASNYNKPDGIYVVPPKAMDSFVSALPLEAIPGVGKVTLEKLHKLGLYYCEDVRHYPFAQLSERFGKFASSLWNYSHASDSRGVKTERKRKSFGVERTLSKDIYSVEQCEKMLDKLYQSLQKRLFDKLESVRVSRAGVKLKFNDFQLTTAEQSADQADRRLFSALLCEAFNRKGSRSIRLVGIYLGVAEKPQQRQMTFDFYSTQ